MSGEHGKEENRIRVWLFVALGAMVAVENTLLVTIAFSSGSSKNRSAPHVLPPNLLFPNLFSPMVCDSCPAFPYLLKRGVKNRIFLSFFLFFILADGFNYVANNIVFNINQMEWSWGEQNTYGLVMEVDMGKKFFNFFLIYNSFQDYITVLQVCWLGLINSRT